MFIEPGDFDQAFREIVKSAVDAGHAVWIFTALDCDAICATKILLVCQDWFFADLTNAAETAS